MASTDFFDDDLSRQRDWGNRGRADEPAVPLSEGGSINAPPRTVADLNLTRMAKHKRDLDDQAASALQELEKLRKRQEMLESEKKSLEDLRRRHDDFDRGKREMIEHLQRSLVVLERQEAEAIRQTELFNATRARFKDLLGSIQSLNEETWPEEQIRDELNKALGFIEEARMDYNKFMARVEAGTPATGPGDAKGSKSAVLFEELHDEPAEKDFLHWLKVGAAVSLPLVVILIIGLVVVLIGRAYGYF